MKFLIILLCISLERFSPISVLMHRFNWFDRCADWLNTLKATRTWPIGMVPVWLIGLPVVILASVVYVLSFLQIGLDWVVSALILLYCLGPDNIYRNPAPAVFTQANTQLYAALFWFVLGGPAATLLYRLIERTTTLPLDTHPWVQQTTLICAYLNWLPIRLFTFTYALVGNFMRTAQYWLDHMVSSWQYNRDLGECSGRIALGIAPDAELGVADYTQALSLIDRSLVVFLVSLLLLNLATFL